MVEFAFSECEDGMLLYLHHMGQQFLEDLVLPVAEEAVCVQRVLLAIQTQFYQVLLVLYFLLGCKCYLGGRPTEIEGSHCGSARAEPVPHETILVRNREQKQKIIFFLCSLSKEPFPTCTVYFHMMPHAIFNHFPLT